MGLCHSFEPAATRGAGTAAFGLWEVTGMGLHRSEQAGVRFPVLGKQNAAVRRLDETTQHRPVCLALPSTGVRLSSHISGNLYLCWRGTSRIDSFANQEYSRMQHFLCGEQAETPNPDFFHAGLSTSR